MKKLRAELQLMKAAFLANAMLMMTIFGFLISLMEEVGATLSMIMLTILVVTAALLSLGASGGLPLGDDEEDSCDEEI